MSDSTLIDNIVEIILAIVAVILGVQSKWQARKIQKLECDIKANTPTPLPPIGTIE